MWRALYWNLDEVLIVIAVDLVGVLVVVALMTIVLPSSARGWKPEMGRAGQGVR